MLYRILADVVLVVHFAFIVLVVIGGLLAVWRLWCAWLHLPAAIWGALIEFFGWVCPLTPLEQHLRRLGGEAGYEAGFIEHYLLPIIYPGAMTRGVQIALGLGVVAINVLIYGWALRRHRQRASGAVNAPGTRR